jgi:hypothetical protein
VSHRAGVVPVTVKFAPVVLLVATNGPDPESYQFCGERDELLAKGASSAYYKINDFRDPPESMDWAEKGWDRQLV